MARNLILNITADGSWQAPDIPNNTVAVKMRTRSTQESMNYRYVNQTAYWEINVNTVEVIKRRLNRGELEVQAANGTIIEVEATTDPEGMFSGYHTL